MSQSSLTLPLEPKPVVDLTERLAAALQPGAGDLRGLWKFQGNGGNGFKTRVSERHILDFNPTWLDFSMFDSLNLDVTDGPVGPGQSAPQEWRSAISLGLGAEWQVHSKLAFKAGYRFYDNPMPDPAMSGALLNATQHVIAGGVRFRQGAHSLALSYGLQLLEAPGTASISSARYGDDLAPMGHLVSLAYSFAF